MNLRNLLEGAALGAFVATSVAVWEHHRVKPMPPVAPIVHTLPAFSPQVAAPVLARRAAQEAWLQRRELEIDKCAAMHGTITLGFGARVVCLDSRAVKFLGEQHPPYDDD